MGLLLENVTKLFGDKAAVKDLSFEMSEPGVFGLIGTNGAGKTTTIRMILGILQQSAGRISWNGRPITRENTNFGYMPEERGIYIKNKVRDQLVYFAMLNGMRKPAAVSAANGWLERLGITEYAEQKAEKLSKGNQQKVQLAAALVHDPDVVFLDEPFSGLDPLNAELFRSVIEELRARGRFIIMSSHQMDVVEEYCRRILILDRGDTILTGDLAEIKAGYGHTNLVVSAEAGIEPTAAECGLKPLEKRALESEYKIESDEQAERFLRKLLDKGICPTKYEIREPSLREIFIMKVGEQR